MTAASPARRSTITLTLNAPVLMSPKRYTDTLPARLRTLPVVDPCPLWCWSLVTRADDGRDATAALREHASTLARTAGLHAVPVGPTWLPSTRPHRAELAPTRSLTRRIQLIAASTMAMSCSVVPPLTPTPAITWPSLVSGTPPPIAEYLPPETARRG